MLVESQTEVVQQLQREASNRFGGREIHQRTRDAFRIDEAVDLASGSDADGVFFVVQNDGDDTEGLPKSSRVFCVNPFATLLPIDDTVVEMARVARKTRQNGRTTTEKFDVYRLRRLRLFEAQTVSIVKCRAKSKRAVIDFGSAMSLSSYRLTIVRIEGVHSAIDGRYRIDQMIGADRIIANIDADIDVKLDRDSIAGAQCLVDAEVDNSARLYFVRLSSQDTAPSNARPPRMPTVNRVVPPPTPPALPKQPQSEVLVRTGRDSVESPTNSGSDTVRDYGCLYDMALSVKVENGPMVDILKMPTKTLISNLLGNCDLREIVYQLIDDFGDSNAVLDAFRSALNEKQTRAAAEECTVPVVWQRSPEDSKPRNAVEDRPDFVAPGWTLSKEQRRIAVDDRTKLHTLQCGPKRNQPRAGIEDRQAFVGASGWTLNEQKRSTIQDRTKLQTRHSLPKEYKPTTSVDVKPGFVVTSGWTPSKEQTITASGDRINLHTWQCAPERNQPRAGMQDRPAFVGSPGWKLNAEQETAAVEDRTEIHSQRSLNEENKPRHAVQGSSIRLRRNTSDRMTYAQPPHRSHVHCVSPPTNYTGPMSPCVSPCAGEPRKAGPLSIAELVSLVKRSELSGIRRIVVLVHEKALGENVRGFFDANEVQAKQFTKGKLNAENYLTQIAPFPVLILNPQVAVNIGSDLFQYISAVVEPVDITSSTGLFNLKKIFHQAHCPTVQWLKMRSLSQLP